MLILLRVNPKVLEMIKQDLSEPTRIVDHDINVHFLTIVGVKWL